MEYLDYETEIMDYTGSLPGLLHLSKNGLSHLLVDLVNRGLVTLVARNGATP